MCTQFQIRIPGSAQPSCHIILLRILNCEGFHKKIRAPKLNGIGVDFCVQNEWQEGQIYLFQVTTEMVNTFIFMEPLKGAIIYSTCGHLLKHIPYFA